MFTRFVPPFLVVFAVFFLTGCPSKRAVTKPIYLRDIVDNRELPNIKTKPDRMKQQLLGHFSNKNHLGGTDEREQEMIVIPIFKERTGEFWMYMEFFSPAMVESPIGRGIQNLIRVSRDTMKMETYFTKDPKKGINEWKKTEPFKGLTKEDLVRADACDYWLISQEDAPYVFKAVPITKSDCPVAVNLAAVKYSQVQYDLSDKGYQMCIQFFDEKMKLLKGCPEGGILFERLDYGIIGYPNRANSEK